MKRIYRDPLKDLQRRQANRDHSNFKRRQALYEKLAAQRASALLAPARFISALNEIKTKTSHERSK